MKLGPTPGAPAVLPPPPVNTCTLSMGDLGSTRKPKRHRAPLENQANVDYPLQTLRALMTHERRTIVTLTKISELWSITSFC